MTTHTSSPLLTTASTRPGGVPRALLLCTLVATALTALLGAAWALAPQGALLGGPPERTALALLLGPTGAAATLGVVALLGAATALVALARRPSRPAERPAVERPADERLAAERPAAERPLPARALPRAVLLPVAAAQVLVAGVGMGSMSTLSTAGYLLALAMPVIVALLVVQVIRRYPRTRLLVGGTTLIVLAAGVLFLGGAVLDLAGYLLPAFVQEIPGIAVTLLLVAVGALWAALTAVSLHGDGTADRLTAWVTRHRLLFTLVAAACPLPYALLRLSWLTPWPLLAPEGIDLSTRLWGLVLSSGSWLGVVLTLGLVLPWGETFPRWMPVLAGREVPVAAAAVPGGAVAALLGFAAVPMLLGAPQMSVADLIVFAVTFPCWLWGPALALAVWGYVGHRRRVGADDPAPDVAGVRTA